MACPRHDRHVRRVGWIAAIWLLFVAGCTAPDERSIVYNSAHFDVFVPHPLPIGVATSIGVQADQMLPEVAALLHTPYGSRAEVRVIEDAGPAAEFILGGPSIILLRTRLLLRTHQLREAIAHELVHLVLQETYGVDTLPYVLEEAIAIYVSQKVGGSANGQLREELHISDLEPHPNLLGFEYDQLKQMPIEERTHHYNCGFELARQIGFCRLIQSLSRPESTRNLLAQLR